MAAFAYHWTQWESVRRKWGIVRFGLSNKYAPLIGGVSKTSRKYQNRNWTNRVRNRHFSVWLVQAVTALKPVTQKACFVTLQSLLTVQVFSVLKAKIEKLKKPECYKPSNKSAVFSMSSNTVSIKWSSPSKIVIGGLVNKRRTTARHPCLAVHNQHTPPRPTPKGLGWPWPPSICVLAPWGRRATLQRWYLLAKPWRPSPHRREGASITQWLYESKSTLIVGSAVFSGSK